MIEAFVSYLRGRSLSENTVAAYRSDVGQLISFLQEHDREVQKTDQEDILSFLEVLTGRGLTGSTKRRKMDAAKTFFRWLRRTGKIERNPLSDFDEMPKVEERVMRVLTELRQQ